MADQSVIIHISYTARDLGPLHRLEEKLSDAVEEAGVGSVDGDDASVDGRDAYIYLYGPDARAIFEVIEPVLTETDFALGAEAQIRYGAVDDEDAEEDIVIIGD